MVALKKQKINLKYNNLPKREASNHNAKFVLTLAILSLIPLFNYFIAPITVVFAIRVLNSIKKFPEKYTGKKMAIIALIIGFLICIFNIIDLTILRWI